MHPNFRALTRAALALLLSTVCHRTAFAQGSLTPPGAPAPMMKSLDQIEPRTPISFLPFTITNPGSYYLTANLTGVVNQNGISISADNVTIDLNGFTLFGGGGGSGEAIWTPTPTAHQNLVVRNGTVRNWPGSGINFYDAGSSLAVVQNIQSISNGFTGFAVKNGSRVTDCIATGNGLRGFIVDNDCLVQRCKAAGTDFGIAAGSNCQLLDNQSTGNTYGLYITGTNNIVGGNIVRLNTNNYSFAQGNQLDIVLSQIPETISWTAKVKLSGSMNVSSGSAITINASGVTLDLNGFTISSTENPAGVSDAAIFLGAVTNVTILNGIISGGVVNNAGTYSGAGFGYGIVTGSGTANVRVSDVSISGCENVGISLGSVGAVESCSVTTMGASGISAARVSNCKVRDCGMIGILADVAINCYAVNCAGTALDVNVANNCEGSSSGSGDGIFGKTANNCIGTSSSGTGIYVNAANNCYGTSVSGTGLTANTANDCYGLSDSAYGIFALNAMGCYGQSSSGTGLSASTAAFCTGSGVTAIQASIGNGCIANGGTLVITNKYNMP